MQPRRAKPGEESAGRKLGRLAATLAIAALGGALAAALGLPAAWLMGSALLVTLASLFGLPLRVPALLRDSAFAIIGLSMGSGVSGNTLALAGRWPLSLVLLAVSVLAVLLAGAWYLERVERYDRTTARLAATPGALSYVLAFAAAMSSDPARVALVQSTRLLLLTAALPLVVELSSSQALTTPVTIPGKAAAGVGLLLLLAGGGALAALLARARVPAGALVGGMLASLFLHGSGILEGGLPSWLQIPGFLVTGSVVGLRFRGIALSRIAVDLRASLGVVTIGGLISGLFALPVSWLLSIPFGQVWVAFAPGGVEAMAAMALAFDFDPAYVALHHLLRLGGLTLAVPLLVGRRR